MSVSAGCVDTAADVFVHESSNICASIPAGQILGCDIAGPKGMYVFSFSGSADLASKTVSSVVTHSSPGDRQDSGTVLFLMTSLALAKSVTASSTGKKCMYIPLSSYFLNQQ